MSFFFMFSCYRQPADKPSYHIIEVREAIVTCKSDVAKPEEKHPVKNIRKPMVPVIQFVTFLGWWKRDLKEGVVGDLQLGDKKITFNHLDSWC